MSNVGQMRAITMGAGATGICAGMIKINARRAK